MTNIAPTNKAPIEPMETPPKNIHLACRMDILSFISVVAFCTLLFTSTNAIAAKAVTDPAIFYALSVNANESTNLYSALGLITYKNVISAPAYTINDLQGIERTLSDHKGKVILLNFWATWCPPCRDEMPAMQRLWERYKDKGFVIIAVSADYNAELAEKYLSDYGLTFPALHDPIGTLSNLYEVKAFPMSFLIDDKGQLKASVVGRMEWDSNEAFALVEQLIEKIK